MSSASDEKYADVFKRIREKKKVRMEEKQNETKGKVLQSPFSSRVLQKLKSQKFDPNDKKSKKVIATSES